jgi:hypothetical protein
MINGLWLSGMILGHILTCFLGSYMQYDKIRYEFDPN